MGMIDIPKGSAPGQVTRDMPKIKNMKGTSSGTAPAGLALLTSGPLLARNTVWNLIGSGAPLLLAIVCVPVLVRQLGTERFGVLTLAWALIGYASLFDLGLGRALTQQVAEKLGTGEHDDIPVLVWTSLVLMLVLGLVGMLVVGFLSPWLVYRVLRIPQALQPETLRAFYLLALSIPIVISTAALRGILEAYQRFDLTSVVRTSMGVLTLAGPLLVIPFSKSLVPVMGVLVGARILAWLGTLWLCFYVIPTLRHGVVPKISALESLIRLGSWMTVTNIVGPLMSYIDRFVIGAMISVVAVAYYTTPSEAVSNLGVIPAGIVGVLFPAFAAGFASNPERVRLLFRRGLKYTFLMLFPVTLLIVVFAREGLQVWLGPEFANNSLRVLQWLAFGRLLNSLAQVPFGLVQGAGRPDLTGKLHLIELPFYLLAVWWLTRTMGIEGAAIAWVARVAVDTVILFVMAQGLLRYSPSIVRRMVFVAGLTILTLGIAVLPMRSPAKVMFVSSTLLVFALVAWRYIRHEGGKQVILSIFARSTKAV
jgi:O-antigen/teichoic acid export membrane protein